MLKRAIESIYLRVFGRNSMQRLNNFFFNLALHAKGYNNYKTQKLSGEEALFNLLAKHNPGLCIDVGANVGDYSKQLLERTGAKVIAFEPLPQSFEILSRLKARFPDRFTIVGKGVGDRVTTLDLHYGSTNTTHASFSIEVNKIDYVGGENVAVCPVEVTTLDEFFKATSFGNDEITMLKVDTEGFEYEVLAGAKLTIAHRRPKFIQLEYNWHQLFRGHSLYQFSEALPGYVSYQLLPYGTGWRKVDPKLPDSNVFCYSNFVFVREDLLPLDL